MGVFHGTVQPAGEPADGSGAFLGHFGSRGLGQETVAHPVGDVAALEPARERRGVVATDQRHVRRGRWGDIGAGRGLEHGEIHPPDPVAWERLDDLSRHRTEVLTDHLAPVAVRLQGEHGEQLLGGIRDIGAVVEPEPVGDPVQASQRHDVVHPQHAREPRLLGDRRRQVPMPLEARRLRKHRAEAPVLTAREALVGRGTDRHAVGEQRLAGPRVVAVGVTAHGEIESQAEPVAVETVPQIVELAPCQDLGHEVKALLLGVHLLGRQHAGPRAGRPVPPVPPQPSLRAAEPSIADQLLIELRRRWRRKSRQGGANFGVCPGHVQGRGRGHGPVGLTEIEDELRPEQPTHRGVRTGLRPLAVEGRHQGQQRDQVTASIRQPAAERLEVSKVAEGAAARRAERGEVGPDSPAPMRPRSAPRVARRRDDGAGPAPAGRFDRKAVVAGRKRLGGFESRPGTLERQDRSALEVDPDLGRLTGDRERSETSVPRHHDGRHQRRIPLSAMRPQRMGGLTRALDRSAQRRADAHQRLGRHDDASAQAVGVAGMDAHRPGERAERLQLIHGDGDDGVDCRRDTE